MATITLYFSKRAKSDRPVDLTRAEYHPEFGKPVVSGYGEKLNSWHAGFDATHLGARVVFEKLFQLLDLKGQFASDVIRQCNGNDALNQLASQIYAKSRFISLILRGEANGESVAELFSYQRGSRSHVEFDEVKFVDRIRLIYFDTAIPHEAESYFQLLADLGFAIEHLKTMMPRKIDVIHLREFGPCLKHFRELEDQIFTAHIARQFSSNAKGVAKRFVTAEQVEELEAGGCHDTISLAEAEEFCDCYGASRIVADWLVSTPTKAPVFLDCFSAADFRPLRDPVDGCTYLTPQLRLEGTDTALVVCKLAGRKAGSAPSQSNHHFHPGDEITVVLKGEVEFYLDSMGVVQRLREFDYIHFEAEHPHVVRNTSDKEAIFISIRILRILDESTRLRFWSVIKDAVADLTSIDNELDHNVDLLSLIPALKKALGASHSIEHLKRKVSRLHRVTEWLLKIRKPANRLEGVPEVVRDFECLHRRVNGFLKYREKRGETVERRKFISNPMLKSVLDGRERPINIADLDVIRDELKVPIALLYDSLIPPIQTATSISKESDWVEPRSHTPGRGTYRLPCRKLLGGDVDIVRLLLNRKERSPLNDHPGFELILCTKGVARIRFSSNNPANGQAAPPADMLIRPLQICHFDSTTPHEVSNEESDLVELFVIRFLDLTFLPFFED